MELMKYCRSSITGKEISANTFKSVEHGKPLCLFCRAEVGFVDGKKVSKHFRISKPESHTCRLNAGRLQREVEQAFRSTFKVNQDQHEIIFRYRIESKLEKKQPIQQYLFKEDIPMHEEDMSYTQQRAAKQVKSYLKNTFHFIEEVYRFLSINHRDNIRKVKFDVGGQVWTLPEFIPTVADTFQLSSSALASHERFFIGTIFRTEWIKNGGFFKIHLYREKVGTEDKYGSILIPKKIFEQLPYDTSKWRKYMQVCVFGKLERDANTASVFVSSPTYIQPIRLHSRSGNFVYSETESHIDYFFYYHKLSYRTISNAEGKERFALKENHFFVPDWIIEGEEKPIVVEFFGYYTEEYKEKTARKIEYYKAMEDIEFVSVFPEDLTDNYKGLREKLVPLIPRIFFNPHFRYLGPRYTL